MVAMMMLLPLAWLVAAPQQLGGSVAVVTTYGDSMLPTYTPSDLVVVKAQAGYDIDDIVAYRSREMGAIALHRIVDVDDDGYITQGDNNDWLDSDRPTDEDILGTARLRIPHAGRLLEVPPAVRAAAVTGLAALAMFGGTARRRRRGRDRRRAFGSSGRYCRSHSDKSIRTPQDKQEASTMSQQAHRASTTSPTWAGWPGVTAAVAGVTALAAGALIVAATVSPGTQPGDVSYTHESTFDYTTSAPQGLVYPEGEVATGEPVFLRLVDTLDLTYTHEITVTSDSTTPTADLTGRLWLEVSDGSGWSHRRPLGPEQQTTDEPLVIEEQLAVPEIRRLVDEIRDEAGVSGNSERIDVVAEIQAEGRLADAPFDDALAPVLSFDVNEQRLSPREDDDEAVGATTEERNVTVGGAEPASIGFAGRSLQVGHARVAGLAGLGGALLALLVATVAALRHGRLDRTDQVRLQYGSKMVEVSSVRPPANHGAVMVRDMATLGQLAELSERPILHHVDDGVHIYVVEDETTQYRYRIAPETPDVEDEGDVGDGGPGDSAESVDDVVPDLANDGEDGEDDPVPDFAPADHQEADLSADQNVSPSNSAESPSASRTEPSPAPASAAPAPAPAPPVAPTKPDAAPAAQPRAPELDIEGLERLFDRSSVPTARRAVEPDEPGHDEPASEPSSQPRARVSDDFFAGRAWSARG